jgi:peroxidase
VGGPFWQVLKGRKDGRVSSASLVPGNLPRPTQSLDELAAVFARKGFTRDEMVVLSGPCERIYRCGILNGTSPQIADLMV